MEQTPQHASEHITVISNKSKSEIMTQHLQSLYGDGGAAGQGGMGSELGLRC